MTKPVPLFDLGTRRKPHAIYDCLRVAAGDCVPDTWRMLQAPVGYHRAGSWELKNYLETNRTMWSCDPAPEQHYARRLAFFVEPGAIPADVLALSRWSFELRVLYVQKVYGYLGVLAAARLEDFFSFDPDNERRLFSSPRRNSRVLDFGQSLPAELHIPCLAHYWIQLAGPSFVAAGDFRLYAMLDGEHEFSVA